MFENLTKFLKKFNKKGENKTVGNNSKNAAKERLHLVLMQDRANVSADFLDLMRHEIIEVIKKYIDVDEKSIDVRLTNIENEDGTNGAPALYANIPILNIKNEARKVDSSKIKEYKEEKKEENKEEIKEEVKQENPQPQENPENKKEEKEEKEEKKEVEKQENKEEDSEKQEKQELTTENN